MILIMAIIRSYITLALVGLVLLLINNLSYLAYAAESEGLGASFIFGDSLVDAGNNNYLSTLSKANIRPNGIDFKPSGGNPTGRYTNGRTIGDIVGKYSPSHHHLVNKFDDRSYIYLINPKKGI